MPKPTDMTPDRAWADAQELLRKRSQVPRMTQLLIGSDRLVLEGRELRRGVGEQRARRGPPGEGGDRQPAPADGGIGVGPRVPRPIALPPEGIVLEPRRLYLAHTAEVLGGRRYAPTFAARSSVARPGLFIHCSGGLGDVGYVGQCWPFPGSCTSPRRAQRVTRARIREDLLGA